MVAIPSRGHTRAVTKSLNVPHMKSKLKNEGCKSTGC